MPKYVNHFSQPNYLEQTILDGEGSTVGTLRIKPSTVSWRPKGAKLFYAVPVQSFAEWITGPEADANRISR